MDNSTISAHSTITIREVALEVALEVTIEDKATRENDNKDCGNVLTLFTGSRTKLVWNYKKLLAYVNFIAKVCGGFIINACTAISAAV